MVNSVGLLLASANTDTYSFPVGMRGSVLNGNYTYEVFKVGNKKFIIIVYYSNPRHFQVVEVK